MINQRPTSPAQADSLSSPKPAVRWPDQHLPADAVVFISNEIVIPASPAEIWPLLIRASDWPAWYSNAAGIHFISTSGPDLRDRTRFRWNAFGLRITCKIREWEPCSRLAWDAHGIGVDAYHAWVLTPQPDGSTHVLTQETQTGWLARIARRLIPGRQAAKHKNWLESLSRKVLALQAARPDRESAA